MRWSSFFAAVLAFTFIAVPGVLLADEIIVAPVPWAPAENRVATGNTTDGISFRNLPDKGDIYIYSINGYQVRHISFDNATTHRASWLGDTDDGKAVASGVYLWLVKSPSLTKSGKLMVIR